MTKATFVLFGAWTFLGWVVIDIVVHKPILGLWDLMFALIFKLVSIHDYRQEDEEREGEGHVG